MQKQTTNKQTQLDFASGMPLLCTSPCPPPSEQLRWMFLFQNPLLTNQRETQKVKVGQRCVGLTNRQLGNKRMYLNFNTFHAVSLLNGSFVCILNYHFLKIFQIEIKADVYLKG